MTFSWSGLTLSADRNPLGDPDLDSEGRCILTDHGKFVIINVSPAAATHGHHPAASSTHPCLFLLLINLSAALPQVYVPNTSGGLRAAFQLKFLRALESLVSRLREEKREIILLGDFNVRTLPSPFYYLPSADCCKADSDSLTLV